MSVLSIGPPSANAEARLACAASGGTGVLVADDRATRAKQHTLQFRPKGQRVSSYGGVLHLPHEN
jgi:hypothetical protein